MASTTPTAVTRRTRSLPHGRMVEPPRAEGRCAMNSLAYDASLDGAIKLPLDLDAEFWASCELDELLELEAWHAMPRLAVRAAAELDRLDASIGLVVRDADASYAALLATVDQLAVVRAAYLAGTATYGAYAEATDAVIRARDEAGVDLRIADLEQQAEQRAELSLPERRELAAQELMQRERGDV